MNVGFNIAAIYIRSRYERIPNLVSEIFSHLFNDMKLRT